MTLYLYYFCILLLFEMKLFFTTFLLFFSLSWFAQMPGGGNKDMMKVMKDIKGRVYGKIIDAKTKKPVEFASVIVLWYNKDSAIAGGFTKENGDFSIDNLPAMGGFRFRATQIGYKTLEQKIYIQAPNKLEQDLGNLKFEIDEKLLNEVEITTQKSTFQMSVDRKVYNVEKDLSVKGGTGIDVLKNIPTITVDGDGNATLREKGVQIYIDGRPTTLTMAQIPADQIEKVEVISNPSVKFEAAASGGIINVVLKKNLKPGYNGVLMANVGTGDRYGTTANINLRENPWNLSLMYSLNMTNSNRVLGKTNRTDFFGNNVESYSEQNSTSLGRNQFQFARISLDYNINNRNTITFAGNYVNGIFKTIDEQNLTQSSNTSTNIITGNRLNNQASGFSNYTGQLLYKKTFPKVGQELTIDANYNQSNTTNGYNFNAYNYINSVEIPFNPIITRNNGGGNSKQYVLQADYVNPISETKKLEYGMRSYYKNSAFINNVDSFSYAINNYKKDTTQSNNYIIDDMINAAYVNYTGKTIWDIGFMTGLRFEHTYYAGRLTDKNTSFSYQYPVDGNTIINALFPGLYLSKKVGSKHEVQFNVSRKIDRPNFFQAMPFVMFSDKFNYRIGNIQLRPEFNNIAELNYNLVFDKGNFLTSAYTRYNQQPITNVAYPSASNPSVTVNTFVNGKDSWRYGFENTLKLNITKNFNTTLNADVFYVILNSGQIGNLPVTTTQGWSYKGKIALNYTLPWAVQLQINGNYEAPKVMINGMTVPNYFMDVSLNKMLKAKWIFNVMLSDAFNTKRFGSHTTNTYFDQTLYRRREARFLRFSVTYLFGKFDTSILKRFSGKNKNSTSQTGQEGGDF